MWVNRASARNSTCSDYPLKNRIFQVTDFSRVLTARVLVLESHKTKWLWITPESHSFAPTKQLLCDGRRIKVGGRVIP